LKPTHQVASRSLEAAIQRQRGVPQPSAEDQRYSEL
jgi:hypothetical protein